MMKEGGQVTVTWDYNTVMERWQERKLDRDMDALFGSAGNPERDLEEDFFFLYLRTVAGFRKLIAGDRNYYRDFWQEFLDYGHAFYELYWHRFAGQGNTYTCAIDLLTFTGELSIAQILHYLPEHGPEPYEENCDFGDCMVYAAQFLASELFSLGEQESAEQILFSLIAYSERKKNQDVRHAGMIVYLLEHIEQYPHAIIQICQQAGAFFAHHKDCADYQNYLWARHTAALALEDKELARESLAECILIREKELDAGSWWIAFPKSRFFTLFRLMEHDGDPFGSQKPEREYVEHFLRKATTNGYGNWSTPTVRIGVGTILALMLQYVYMRYDRLPEVKEFISLHEELCKEFDEELSVPLLTNQMATVMKAACCLEDGKLMEAENLFREALAMGIDPNLQEVMGITHQMLNLLTVYYRQTDFEKADTLIRELLDLLPEETKSMAALAQVMDYQIGIAQMLQEDDAEMDSSLIAYIEQFANEIRVLPPDEILELEDPVIALLLDAIAYFAGNKTKEMSGDLLQNCAATINYLQENQDGLIRRDSLKVSLSLNKALLAMRQGKTEAAELARLTAMILDQNTIPRQQKIGGFGTCALILESCGFSQEATAMIQEGLTFISDTWHESVQYYNNARLSAFLLPAQQVFAYTSGIAWKSMSTEENYERVLRFKSLASLAGRERNRYLHHSKVDPELLERVNRLQDRIARAELDTMIHSESASLEEDKEELRKLEAELGKQFPNNMDTIDISLDKVLSAIPDDSAVLEYQVYVARNEEPIPLQEKMAYPVRIDTYLVEKKDGAAQLTCQSIPAANKLVEQVGLVADVFRRESLDSDDPNAVTMVDIQARDQALKDLYAALIEPFQEKLSKFKTLYIAPDQDLIALPFELLRPDTPEKTYLSDQFTVIRINSARDFLYENDEPMGDKSLLLGNPQYDISSEEGSGSERRLRDIRAESVTQLPFSEREAQRAAAICHAPCVVGKTATKSLLSDTENYRLIHLATHGYFDSAYEHNALYSSFLLFAGARSWMTSGQEDPIYGNGIMTADEISRLDLRSVELVVLSACFSGMTENVGTQNLTGLLGGFAAAGVKYVVTHLWSANDMATSVLMEYFYEGYILRGKKPAAALSEAQLRLRNTTVADLARMGIIQYGIDHAEEGSRERRAYERMKRRPAQSRPFASEYYWGGFSCHQCY